MGRILTLDQAVTLRQQLRRQGKTVVFTNGCFDILHRGHVDILSASAALGDVLVVGLNDDASVCRLKGKDRPINSQQDRGAVLAALEVVDVVVVFPEDTPELLIRELLPDVLVKGADYAVEDIVGAEQVIAHGGRVERIPLTEGHSTSRVIKRISKPGSD